MSNVDLSIVALYLSLTLFVGIKSGIGKKINVTMKDYALGNRNFTTYTLAATFTASLISGTGVMGLTTGIYNKGMIFGLVFMGFPISIMITKYIVASRIKYFVGCCSIGDIMHKIFGNQSQILVGCISFIRGIGTVMGQILALGMISHYFFGIDDKLGMLIGGGIIITYSAFGGIRAVIATDIIQFAVLLIAIPIVLYISISTVGGYNTLLDRIPDISTQEYDLVGYFIIFLSFCIPRMSPGMIQRCLAAKNTKQLYYSLNAAATIVAIYTLITILIGVASAMLYPGVDASYIFPHLVQNLIPVGFTGLVIAGVIAIIMSTADTELNAGSIALVNDVIHKIGYFKRINGPLLTSFITIIMGCIAILIATHFKSVLDAMLFASLLWYPVMICPLILGVYGLKSDDKTFIFSTIITAIGVVIFHNTWSHNFALSNLCGIAFNCIIFLSTYSARRKMLRYHPVSSHTINPIN